MQILTSHISAHKTVGKFRRCETTKWLGGLIQWNPASLCPWPPQCVILSGLVNRVAMVAEMKEILQGPPLTIPDLVATARCLTNSPQRLKLSPKYICYYR